MQAQRPSFAEAVSGGAEWALALLLALLVVLGARTLWTFVRVRFASARQRRSGQEWANRIK
jgi:hypothetical protein